MGLKILFTPSDNNLAGAFQSMVRLCILLRDKYGCDVLVLLRRNGRGEELLKENGIRYLKIKSYNWIIPDHPSSLFRKAELCVRLVTKPFAQLYNQLAIVRIKKLIRDEKVDIVHQNTSYIYAPAKAAIKSDVPLVWHLREFLEEDQHKRINLRIAGKESEYVNFLRNYIGSKNLDKWIQFIGPQSDIKQLYRDTDIVLMCSQSEAFGRVTVEAMMSGCLVIGANSGGTMELVSDNETGLLYTSGDYSDLAAKIRLALKYPDRMRDIAKQGQSKMLNEMTAQNNAFRINELYREIVSDTEGI